MTDAPRPPRLLGLVAATLAPMGLLFTLSAAGCGQEPLHSEQGSPVVTVESEAGKKALAESQKLLDLRKKQEAKAGRRGRASHAAPG